MAKRGSVPQFGTWENQNVGYTMYFEQVRNNKSGGPTKMINPNDPQEMQHANFGAKIINPNDPQEMQHANFGGSSNIAPPHATAPKPNQHRSKPETRRQDQDHHQNYHNQKPNHNYNGGSSLEPSPARSRPSPGPNRRPNAVPKFGEWEDINSTPAGGYTMQFDNLKKKKEATKASPIQLPPEPVHTPPERNTYHNDTSFFSKLFGCFSPHTRD